MTKSRVVLICALVVCVAISVNGTALENDTTAITKLISATIKSMEQEDFESYISYWAQESPEYAPHKQRAQDFFALVENIRIEVRSLSHWNVGAERASVRIRFQMQWVDSNSKQQKSDTSVWLGHFVKQHDSWKWWDREGLVSLLVQSKSQSERADLLNEEKDILSAEMVDAIGDVAEAEFKKGNVNESLRISDVAEELARFLKSKKAMASYHMLKGNLLRSMRDFEKAGEEYKRALGLSREAKDKGVEAVVLGNLSANLLDSGHSQEAIKTLETLRKLFESTGEKLQEASVLLNLGNAYHTIGVYGNARQAFEDALVIVRLPTVLDREGEAMALNGLGMVYTSMGQLGDGLRKHQEAREFSRQWNIATEESAAQHNIAEVYLRSGYYSEAEKEFFAAKSMSQQAKDPRGMAMADLGIANTKARTGRYGDALLIYDQLLDVFEKAQDQEALSYLWDALAGTYYSLGRYREALVVARKSLDFSKDRGDKKRQGAELNNIANILAAMGKYDEAVLTLKDSLGLAAGSDDKAIVLNNLGEMYQKNGELEPALDAYEESLKIKRTSGNRLGEATTLNNIALVYSTKGDKKKALDMLNQALDLATPLDDVSSTFPIHSNIGDVHFDQHKWKAAVDAHTKAVDRIEKVRSETREGSLQLSFLGKYIPSYHRLMRSYVELHLNEKAFVTSEQAKARTLRDVLARGHRFEANLTKGEQEKKNILERRVSTAEERLAAARQRKNDVRPIEEELAAARDAYDLFLSHLLIRYSTAADKKAVDLQPISLAHLNSALLSKSRSLTLLSYVASEDGVLLFVVTPRRSPALSVHRLKNYKGNDLKYSELIPLAEEFRLRAATNNAPYKTISRTLYKLLVAPAEQEIIRSTQLIIVPDGVLGALPFQALLNERDEFLIQRFAVSYAPSATALVSMMALEDQRRAQVWPPGLSMLAVGRSSFSDIPTYRDSPLPLAGQQAKQIASLFGVREIIEAEATEERIKSLLPQVRFAHFATHAELSKDAPMYSAIILAPNNKEDGILYAREIAELRLKTELVVLAACETGLGELVPGEGIMGSSWALFVAGSPSAAVSQWKVLDESTTLLMREFYGELSPLRKRKTTKVRALQQAQLKLMRDGKHEHPYFWAPFILIGGWQ